MPLARSRVVLVDRLETCEMAFSSDTYDAVVHDHDKLADSFIPIAAKIRDFFVSFVILELYTPPVITGFDVDEIQHSHLRRNPGQR